MVDKKEVVMSELSDALASAKLKITKYDPAKSRSVSTSRGTYSIEKFSKMLFEILGTESLNFPKVCDAFKDLEKMELLVAAHAKATKVEVREKQIIIPNELAGLTLNCNMAAKGRDDRFFLTHEDETVSPITGEFYLLSHQLTPPEAVSISRNVVPEYLPRQAKGVFEMTIGRKTRTVFNIYTPPEWTTYPKWDELPDKLPILFSKLVKHLFPLPEEREFFFYWLHASLFRRAFTFLVLCGAPGTGKNRLKIVMRALHEHVNTTDGKKSTLTERFNSQLGESTLTWFDELQYDADMENTMKELQNDSISIERKGVDATRATKIHSSIVISNNKPRDNHIAFDARKFVPLVVAKERLEASMAPAEIDALSLKVEDPTREEYDIHFIAQIAKWIERHGDSKKWPNQEYRGPMFWTLAHTSMTRWQKKAAMLILDPSTRPSRVDYDEAKGYLWSALSEKGLRKNGDRTLQFPDHTSVKAFFEVFRDSKGRKAFSTKEVPDNIMGDFWVKPLFKKTAIITEASVVEERNRASAKTVKEKYDL